MLRLTLGDCGVWTPVHLNQPTGPALSTYTPGTTTFSAQSMTVFALYTRRSSTSGLTWPTYALNYLANAARYLAKAVVPLRRPAGHS